MELWELGLVTLLAFATAVLTAIAGLGGGTILLVALLQLLPPAEAIPVHGAIQLVSNASRAWTLRTYIAWPLVARHAILLVPGGLLGLQVATRLSKDLARATIGVFALFATWRPRWIVPHVEGRFPARGFLWVGLLHGAINMPIGASGPMIAPFFKSALGDRREVVSTFSAAQVSGHLVKIALFGWAGFAFVDHLPTIVLGSVGVTLGTLVGARGLEKLSEKNFQWLFRMAVTAVAIPLVLSAF